MELNRRIEVSGFDGDAIEHGQRPLERKTMVNLWFREDFTESHRVAKCKAFEASPRCETAGCAEPQGEVYH